MKYGDNGTEIRANAWIAAPLEAHQDAAERPYIEGDFLIIRIELDGRRHGSGDDEIAGSPFLARARQQIGDNRCRSRALVVKAKPALGQFRERTSAPVFR